MTIGLWRSWTLGFHEAPSCTCTGASPEILPSSKGGNPLRSSDTRLYWPWLSHLLSQALLCLCQGWKSQVNREIRVVEPKPPKGVHCLSMLPSWGLVTSWVEYKFWGQDLSLSPPPSHSPKISSSHLLPLSHSLPHPGHPSTIQDVKSEPWISLTCFLLSTMIIPWDKEPQSLANTRG